MCKKKKNVSVHELSQKKKNASIMEVKNASRLNKHQQFDIQM